MAWRTAAHSEEEAIGREAWRKRRSLRRPRTGVRSASVETRRATWILQKITFENHRGISIDDSFTPAQGLSFAFLDHTDNLLQIFFAKAARFDEMYEQRLGRAIENAIDEFPDHAA